MDALREYFISVCAAAIICGVIVSLIHIKSGTGELVKLVAGLFLALTVIRPLAQIDLAVMTDLKLDHSQWASEAAAVGENLAKESLQDIIKTRTEAYILDKAASLGLDIQVTVTLSDDQTPMPTAVHIHGSASPYAKSQLCDVLTNELGIAKEDQIWTG